MRSKLFYLGIFILVLSSAANSKGNKITPLVKILDNPKSYDNQKVTTIGKINLEFENDTLTIIPCAPIEASKPIAIWVDASKINRLEKGYPNHMNVKVSGTFNTKNKGHMGEFPGTLILDNIEKLSEKDKSLNCKM